MLTEVTCSNWATTLAYKGGADAADHEIGGQDNRIEVLDHGRDRIGGDDTVERVYNDERIRKENLID